MKNEHTPTTGRRRALLGLGLAGTGAAIAVVTAGRGQAVADQATASAPPTPERGGGYHLSERAKQYYRSTRI